MRQSTIHFHGGQTGNAGADYVGGEAITRTDLQRVRTQLEAVESPRQEFSNQGFFPIPRATDPAVEQVLYRSRRRSTRLATAIGPTAQTSSVETRMISLEVPRNLTSAAPAAPKMVASPAEIESRNSGQVHRIAEEGKKG